MTSLGEVNRYWLIAIALFFIIVGSFGNINIIWSTMRKPELRDFRNSARHNFSTSIRVPAVVVRGRYSALVPH
ncbi:hypothetical protein Aduo_017335 [Ancylostoma duodenale]